MMTLKNKVQLVGNVGQTPELITSPSGTQRLKLSLATNDYYTSAKGEKVKDTQWHNCIAWGKTAENLQRTLRKGSEVAIVGKLQHRNYQDKTGMKKYITEILVQEFYLTGDRSINKPVEVPAVVTEDLPF